MDSEKKFKERPPDEEVLAAMQLALLLDSDKINADPVSFGEAFLELLDDHQSTVNEKSFTIRQYNITQEIVLHSAEAYRPPAPDAPLKLALEGKPTCDTSRDSEETGSTKASYTAYLRANANPAKGCVAHNGRQRSACDKVSLPGYRHCETHLQMALEMMIQPTGPLGRQLDFLLSMMKASPDIVWTVDAEFTNFRDTCPVAWSLCVRRLKDDEIVLFCNVDYGSKTFQDIIDEVHHHMEPSEELNIHTRNRAEATFRRIYGRGERTNGFTPSTIRQHLLAQGFDTSTHALMSYGSSSPEREIMCKILAGQDELMVRRAANASFGLNTTHYACLDPIDLQRIFKAAMVKDQPTGYSLEEIYRKLFGGRPDAKMHTADVDTLILNDVTRALVRLRANR